MILTQDLKDTIEDALIHLEDAKFTYHISSWFHLRNETGNMYSSNKKIYDLLKKGIDRGFINNEYIFGNTINITIQRNSVMNWKDWNWYQQTLKTAITRMTDNLDKVSVTEGSTTEVELFGKEWKVKNLGDLTTSCQYFNLNNPYYSGGLVASPEYHPEEGIVLYIREIPQGGEKRFTLFNKALKDGMIEEIGKEKLYGHDIKISTSKSDGFVSIERAFGSDCVEKMYEEGEVIKDNSYLENSPLAKYIVAKIKTNIR